MITLIEPASVPVSDGPREDAAPFTETGRQAAEYWFKHVVTAKDYDARREWFAVLFLDQERRLLGHTVLPPGGESFVVTKPSQIFRPALRAGAESIVCIHNHPSTKEGEEDVSASPADLNQFCSLIGIGRGLDMAVIDSVIVTASGAWSSMADDGWLEFDRSVRPESPASDEDKARLLITLLAPAPELLVLVCDAAHKAGQAAHDFLFALALEFVKGHLTAGPGSDPKLSLASMLLRMDRDPMIDPIWSREAMGEEKSISDFIWRKALSLLREYETSARPSFNAPSTARVTVEGV